MDKKMLRAEAAQQFYIKKIIIIIINIYMYTQTYIYI